MKITKCKYCDRYFDEVDQYVAHLEKDHSELIPEDMTPFQFYYYLKTGKTMTKRRNDMNSLWMLYVENLHYGMIRHINIRDFAKTLIVRRNTKKHLEIE